MNAPHPLAGRQRPLSEISTQVWRALAGAGPRGIGEPDLLSRVSAIADRDTLNRRLHQLMTCGYSQRSGEKHAAVWTATRKIPLGEDAPAWQQDFGPEDDDDDPPRRTAPASPEPGAAASVFDLGDRAIAPGWGLAGSAAPRPLNKPAAAKGGTLKDGASWKPALPKVQVTAAQVAAKAECVPAGRPVIALPLLPAAGGTAEPSSTKPLPEPIFELHSDGMLVLDLSEGEPEGQVVLPPRVTRALFRWLDVLGGTTLQRMVPRVPS